MNNKVPIFVFLSLLVLLLMQLGASLFAITVAVSTLIESPPESLAMTQGDFPYDSSIFWDVYPNILGTVFLIALILNWRTRFKKWILISFGLYIAMALFAIFIFLFIPFGKLFPKQGGFLIASSAAIALLIPVFKQLNETR